MKLIQKIRPFKSPQDSFIFWGREGNFRLGFNFGTGYIEFVIKGWKFRIITLRY